MGKTVDLTVVQKTIIDTVHKEGKQKIRILNKTNTKKNFFVNCWPSGKHVDLLYMYSILGRGSFCFNYCLNSPWHRGD